jgi:hypothetical protein
MNTPDQTPTTWTRRFKIVIAGAAFAALAVFGAAAADVPETPDVETEEQAGGTWSFFSGGGKGGGPGSGTNGATWS